MIRLIGTLAAIYVLVLGALYLLQRSLMYFPDRTRPAPAAFGVGELAACDGQPDTWKQPPG